MSETSIQWTDYTFNPWWGCVRVSPGCENCYAETFSHRLGMDLWGPTAGRRYFDDKHWNEPLRWQARRRKGDPRHRVFCASMADVFETCPAQRHNEDTGHPCLCSERWRLFRLIEATPDLTWQLLTKRPENMVKLAPESWAKGWPANVWAMTTAEDQQRLDLRAPLLLRVPARVRGISYEPALGRISFRWAKWHPIHATQNTGHLDGMRGIHWVIVGGESGNGARPFDPAWAREVLAQCREAGAAAFVKQMGRWISGDHAGFSLDRWRCADGRIWVPPIFGARAFARPPDAEAFTLGGKGGDMDFWAEDLRVREFPSCA